jgi:ABC-type oligopeptide transport system substrate-binding subunit
MRTSPFRSTAAMLLCALSVSLLVGCATSQERNSQALSSEEFQLLYPYRHFDSLDPWDRRDVERRMMDEDIQQRERERGR